MAACEAGFGLIQVPRYHVVRRLAAGAMVEVLQAYQPPPLPLSAGVSRKTRHPRRGCGCSSTGWLDVRRAALNRPRPALLGAAEQ